MKMIIQKRYKDPNREWEETTLDQCLQATEGSGYWKQGSVKEGLKAGLIVNTPFAQYRCTEYTQDGITRTNRF